MFDIIRSIKKITGLYKKEQVEPAKELEQAPAATLEHKIDKISGLFDQLSARAIVEYRIIRDKFQDLSKTNYDLGMRYMEEGNIKEAIFRFKITKKFWPHNYEAYYELIYCLLLESDFESAQKVIDELLEKSPDYKEKIDKLLSPQEPELEEQTQELASEKFDVTKDNLIGGREDSENPNQQ